MDLSATAPDFAGWIGEVLRCEPSDEGETYVYRLRYPRVERTFSLPKQLLESTAITLSGMDDVENSVICSPRYSESLVRDESTFPSLRTNPGDDVLSISDTDNGIRYKLSGPSNEYLLYLMYKVSRIASPRTLVFYPMQPLLERVREEEFTDVFSFLRRVIRTMTLRVESDRNRNASDLEGFANAFLFNLSYNTDVAIVRQRHIEELVRTGRIARIRRSSLEELDVPRRRYVPDLVHHYQLAVAADNPFLQFISYYHVAEHFFENVYHEDLVARVRNKITAPDFSYKRNKDIQGLITDISRSLQIRNERITFSEQEALRLVLERFVDVIDLKSKVEHYDPSLLDYYRDSPVSFSKGDTVDLTDSDHTQVRKKMAARIYKTRNALVHSKESDKERYVPFRDDRLLLREVPLLRFVAEQIIVLSSSTAN